MTINLINQKEMEDEIKQCSECETYTGSLIPYRHQYQSYEGDNDFSFHFEINYICIQCLVKKGLKLD